MIKLNMHKYQGDGVQLCLETLEYEISISHCRILFIIGCCAGILPKKEACICRKLIREAWCGKRGVVTCLFLTPSHSSSSVSSACVHHANHLQKTSSSSSASSFSVGAARSAPTIPSRCNVCCRCLRRTLPTSMGEGEEDAGE